MPQRPLRTSRNSTTPQRCQPSSRRRFLGTTSAALAAATASLCGCTLPVRSVRVAAQGRRVAVPLADYPELTRPGGVVKVLRGADDAIFLRNIDGEKLLGISAICTHQGCVIDAGRHGFRCPCHGSTYNATGEVTSGPASADLPIYRVERQGGQVVLHLG